MELKNLISQNVVSGETVKTANAEKLHLFLEAKSKFADWIKNRIQKYGFIENQDYIKTTRKVGNATAHDYYLTIDMAKELCMVENNDKGREARRYFIECEKNLIKIGEAYAKENDPNFVPYNLLYSKERECIELKRAMNRITENEKLIFGDANTHNAILDLLGYASRATKTIRHLGEELVDYADKMEKGLKVVEQNHAHKNGVTTQCKRLPRHQERKD